MNYEDILKDNSIIICENNYKNKILEYLNENKMFLNIKFMSKHEFLNKYFFSYDEKTIEYLINKYDLKIDIIKMYLSNLYYIDEFVNYDNNKLNFLVNLKKDLKENDLLIEDPYFKNNIQNSNVYFIGYPYLESYLEVLLDNDNYKYIKEVGNYNIENVYELYDIREEIDFVLNKICSYIESGIDINKIKICNISSDYYNDLETYSNFYNLKIDIKNSNSLYSNIIFKKFLDNIDKGINESIELIKDCDKDIVNEIINICNKYVKVTNNDIKLKLIIDSAKETNIKKEKYKNVIEVVDYNYPFTNDEYVFMMNFNNGSIPKYVRDEDYLTDNIKDFVYEKKTVLKNKLIKEYTIEKIKQIKNLIITYKKNGKSEEYPSSLIDELNLNVIKNIEFNKVSYSKKLDYIKYSNYLDELRIYGSINDRLKYYKSTYDNIDYNTYDNKFNNIEYDMLKEYLDSKLTLSYSSLNDFNKCSFKYYLNNILKINKYESSFEAFIGSLFHDVLEKCLKEEINIEKEIKNFIDVNNKEFSFKEKFFINKIKKEIIFAVDALKENNSYMELKDAYYEKNLVVDKSNDYNIIFKGLVDKILYKEYQDETVVAIVDYKTGLVDTDLKYLKYGLGLQLPMYLYLVKKSNLFDNPKFAGFYINYIINDDNSIEANKTVEDKKRENLKLVGYSNSNINILSRFDETYKNSKLIRGLKVKNDGSFNANSKVLDDDAINNIILEVDNIIDDNINKIINGNFEVNPIKLSNKDEILGCKYCKYKDICYKREEDIREIDVKAGDYDELD